MANKSPWQRAFIQGYACAVANIIRTHGEDGIAWDVFVANKCEPKECDAGDREVLQKAGFFNRRARKETRPAPTSRPEHVAAHDCACAECVPAEPIKAKVRQNYAQRCSCNDYPGADEFCTAHKVETGVADA